MKLIECAFNIAEPKFSGKDVAAVLGISEKDLQNWSGRGVLDVRGGNPGTGHKRMYSFSDVVVLTAARTLAEWKIPIIEAGRMTRGVTEWLERFNVCGFEFDQEEMAVMPITRTDAGQYQCPGFLTGMAEITKHLLGYKDLGFRSIMLLDLGAILDEITPKLEAALGVRES